MKCIITDIGGVCVSNVYAIMSETLNSRFGADRSQAFRILREEAVAFDAGHVTVDDFCSGVLKKLDLKIDRDEFVSILDSSITPNEDVCNLLQRARTQGKAKLIALSNMPEHTWNMLRSRFALNAQFDDAVLSFVLGIVKPDERIFEAAIRISGTSPGNCLFIDDAPENVAAAEHQGMVSHLFRDAADLVYFLKNNDIIIP